MSRMILSLLMFLPAFITATITAFLCGILMKFGYVSFLTVWIAIIVGDMISNIFWYMAGRIGGAAFIATFGKLFGITQDHLVGSLNIFNKFKDYIAFFVSAPVGMAMMLIGFMNAGIQKHGFWKYLVANTLVSAVWIWLMLALGYGFGQACVVFGSILGRVVTSLGLLAVLFLLLTLGAWIRTLILSAIYKPTAAPKVTPPAQKP